MSLIQSVRDYLLTYEGLDDDAGFLIDVLNATPTQYALVPLPGVKIIESYLDGSSLRQYPFALQSMDSIADDAARIQVNEFYEAFSDWLESQSEAEILPTMDSGKTPESIEAIGQPVLFQFGESGTGIYQLQCRLVYKQAA